MNLRVNEALKQQLQAVNRQLLDSYQQGTLIDKQQFRQYIQDGIGSIGKIEKMSKSALKGLGKGRPIIGVDGSINHTGGNYPHYLGLLQGLAKSIVGNDQIYQCAVHVPLLKEEKVALEEMKQDNPKAPLNALDSQRRTSKLAGLELAVATEAIKRWKPLVIMLDGSLIRFSIEVPQAWESFAQLALEQGVTVAGVIEEIGTQMLCDGLVGQMPELQWRYDRELLFDLLEYGEYLEIKEQYSKQPNIRTCFLRMSSDPQAVGLDMLSDQFDQMGFVSELLFSLTPEHGRGIPIWLDIVDSEVRITHEMLEILIDTYIEEGLRRKLFLPKRRERSL